MNEDVTIPHEVVRAVVKNEYSWARAWREYLGLTQKEVAEKMGIAQTDYIKMEDSTKKLADGTAIKLAGALGIDPEQLRDLD